jgi:GNAT superfamily N-acetyltransferase
VIRVVRPAQPDDVPTLARLCADHARYERSACDPAGLAERLAAALFGKPARALAWIAELDGAAVGYASGAAEFSTWTAREFLHLDCLYLDEQARGAGLGSALLHAAAEAGRRRGLETMQWWTPAWNEPAARFYEAQGARAAARLRYTLEL